MALHTSVVERRGGCADGYDGQAADQLVKAQQNHIRYFGQSSVKTAVNIKNSHLIYPTLFS